MNLLRLLWRASRASFVAAAVCGALGGAASAVALLSVSRGLRDGPSVGAVLVFVGACLVLLTARFLTQWLVARLSQQALYELRTTLAARMVSAPLQQLERLGQARLLTALTDDALVISDALPGVPAICTDVAIIAGCLAAMAALSPALFAVSVVLLVVGLLTFALPARASEASLRRARTAVDQLAGLYRALTDGAKELKLSRARREAFLHGALKDAALDYRRHHLASMTVWAAGASWGQTLFLASVGLLLFAGARVAEVGPTTLSSYLLVVLYLATPLEFIVALLPSVGRAQVALASLEALRAELQHEPQAPDATNPPAPRQLVLEGVTWGYPSEGGEAGFSVGPIDLTLRAGEVVFLAGGNGTGKTTLAKLVCGLYTPVGGRVLLGEDPVTAQTREQHRELVGAVFADSWLFDRPDLVRGDAAQWLRRLGLEGKVALVDGKWTTTALSHGQRRRLLLATALLAERPFLVFDEWAADQDAASRAFFYRELLPELRAKGKGVLVVSHDERFFDVADRVLNLEAGRLVGREHQAPAG